VRIYLTIALLVVLIVIAFIFGSQNSQEITLNYLVARAEMPVAHAVAIFTIIGIVIGVLISLLWKLSRALKPKKTLPITEG
jgi:putative membrane protein